MTGVYPGVYQGGYNQGVYQVGIAWMCTTVGIAWMGTTVGEREAPRWVKGRHHGGYERFKPVYGL